MDVTHRMSLRNELRGVALRAVSLLASAALLAGCTDKIAGAPVGPAADGEPNVAQLDTGNYPVTAGHAYGTAGSLAGPEQAAALLEAHRLAEDVIGPWQIDSTLLDRRIASTLSVTPEASSLSTALNSDDKDHAMVGIALAHGFVAGFSSTRSNPGDKLKRLLKNVVLMFPDEASAAAAAGEMAAKAPEVILGPTAKPAKIDVHPEAIASVAEGPDPATAHAASFAAHGRYVLYQYVYYRAIDTFTAVLRAPDLVFSTLNQQETLIDRFVPTDPDKMRDLPLDPTGQLLARTLWMPDGKAPLQVGVWQPNAALHFEADPVTSAADFAKANVQVVTQRWAKVYQTSAAPDATRLAGMFSGQIHDLPEVTPTTPVPGFPGAKCFERTHGWVPTTELISAQQAGWHYTCIAHTDRYVFQTFSDREPDVKQQVSAQYRILAGK